MSVTVVIGSQWGDEGKGKIVDLLSEKVDVVVRYQGGANAGHTIFVNDKKFVLHLIPSGIIRENILCVIGNGVVLDPSEFLNELNLLKQNGIEVENRIKILPNTHIVLLSQKVIDGWNEIREDLSIGTTKKGIGPAYTDKYARLGIRAIDFFNDDYLDQMLENNTQFKDALSAYFYLGDDFIVQEIKEQLNKEKIKPFIVNDPMYIAKLVDEGKNVLLEGAQGALLDVDFGTYPYVTSSNPTIGGAITGTGISPKKITEIIGVTKAYCTRVGSGPFPTEQENEIGEKLRESGNEFGATTGRPRRCGWLDLPALKYSSLINDFDYLAITKLDVLSEFDEIKVCTAYKLNGEIIDYFPIDSPTLAKVEPVYESFQGWKKTINGIRNLNELPKEARKYLEFIEDYLSIKIKIISTGFERNDTIII